MLKAPGRHADPLTHRHASASWNAQAGYFSHAHRIRRRGVEAKDRSNGPSERSPSAIVAVTGALPQQEPAAGSGKIGGVIVSDVNADAIANNLSDNAQGSEWFALVPSRYKMLTAASASFVICNMVSLRYRLTRSTLHQLCAFSFVRCWLIVF
jgi:hypothetical protein